MSIEQLMESEVTSVSKTDQKFSDTAAAVYIVTQDDIRRSGVTNIPDVLRMVPGVQVARISASEWAVTARGFNGRFANKLLVLLDGRTVYSPTFAGVLWENLDLVLADIERIEVIRGPGASVWGQNAVNGVINIITKHSEETRQGLFSVTAGNEERAIVQLRYGEQLGDKGQYRVYGKFLLRDGLIDLQGNNAKDDWTQGRGGFRIDWDSDADSRWMLEGDGYVGEMNEGFLLPSDNSFGPARRGARQNSGASILGRWEKDFSVASRTTTQLYYSYFNDFDPVFGSERRDTVDFDFQHDIALFKDYYFNWGLGYRYVADSFFDGQFTRRTPVHLDLHLISAFVQGKGIYFNDALHVTVGTKAQYYTLSGWDYQPSVRLLWKIHPRHRLWASFSRATRSPSSGEKGVTVGPLAVPAQSPFTFVLQANPDFDEERVFSYELGYRTWLADNFSMDLALFYNHYEDQVTASVGQPDPVSGQIPLTLLNEQIANSWGIEAATDWRPFDRLRLQVSYSLLQVQIHSGNRFSLERTDRRDPANQLSFRGSYDFSRSVAFDVWLRYVDSISVSNTLFGSPLSVDSYVGLDMRLAWKPVPNLELVIVGQNLNNRAHLEYIEEAFAYPVQIERSIYGQIQWTF